MEQVLESEVDYFSFFWGYARQEKKNLRYLILLLLGNTLLTILAPLFFKRALDVIEDRQNIGEDDVLKRTIIIALMIYLLLTLLSWIAQASVSVISTRLNANIIRKIRIDTFHSLMKNRVEFFDHQESGNLTSIITNDLRELYNAGNAIAEVITSSMRLLGILGVLFFFSPILTLSAIILLPIFFAISLAIRNFRRKSVSLWRKNFGKVNHSFAEIMRSIAISKAFNREDENVKLFAELNEATYQASIRRGAAIFINRPIADFLRNILLIMVLGVGTWLVTNQNLSIASFFLFIFLIDLYFEPVRAIASNYNQFQGLFAILDRILIVLQPGQGLEENFGAIDVDQFQGDIEFKDVNFSYTKDVPVLTNINFKIKPGQRVALVGDTGAGKSTIAALLMRFYDIDDGEILLDGSNIDEYHLPKLRRRISLVSQRVLLFKGSLMDNMLIANPQATEEDIWEILDAVHAREYIESLPNGLHMLLDEGGMNLSAGQRQIISFARALLAKPNIILLDEATSAVDLYTEAQIQESTDLLLKKSTSLVIAHRLTTIIRSDLILVLEDGKLIQSGTHKDLMLQEGNYKQMYELYFQTQSAEYLNQIRHDE